MKTVIVEVAIRIKDDADELDVISDCDYEFNHNDILDTEIIAVRGDSLV